MSRKQKTRLAGTLARISRQTIKQAVLEDERPREPVLTQPGRINDWRAFTLDGGVHLTENSQCRTRKRFIPRPEKDADKMTSLDSIKESYLRPGHIVVTAHRGFSGKYPENTLEAFREAVELGVSFVEFDVRCSKDGVPMVMHDATLDRTTNGHGEVGSLTHAELSKLNASYWKGPHDTGARLDAPARAEAHIPSLEEAIELLAGKALINIQVYEQSRSGQKEICRLYRRHDLYDKAFLMMESFAAAEDIRKIDRDIELCVGEARHDLKRHKAFGSTFVQPEWQLVNHAFSEEARALGLCPNMFYANTAKDGWKYIALGMTGIMSDRPDIIMELAGKAAGAMAALCARTGVDPEELPLADVYTLLREHGAGVPTNLKHE